MTDLCGGVSTDPGAPSSKPTSGLYMDRKGLKRGIPLPAIRAVSSALGSPRSSLETDPVAKMASLRWATCAPCSMTAVESPGRGSAGGRWPCPPCPRPAGGRSSRTGGRAGTGKAGPDPAPAVKGKPTVSCLAAPRYATGGRASEHGRLPKKCSIAPTMRLPVDGEAPAAQRCRTASSVAPSPTL